MRMEMVDKQRTTTPLMARRTQSRTATPGIAWMARYDDRHRDDDDEDDVDDDGDDDDNGGDDDDDDAVGNNKSRNRAQCGCQERKFLICRRQES